MRASSGGEIPGGMERSGRHREEDRSSLAAAAAVLGLVGLALVPLGPLILARPVEPADLSPVAGAAFVFSSLLAGLLAVVLGLVSRRSESRWLAVTGVALGSLVGLGFAVTLAVS
ncbi:MAG: hypothetical protein HY658_13865 [Actinobacteria bacterium]|nr:hypothetical protein [Actinomycetota bacterium]